MTSKKGLDSRGQSQERRHLRRDCPTLGIRFKAVIYQTMDWSLGGFAIKGSCPMIEGFGVGDEVTGTFGLSGSLPEHQFSAVVTRIDAKTCTTGFKFSTLYLDGLKVLENLLSHSRQVDRDQRRKLAARSMR
jgi:hypothetical protein